MSLIWFICMIVMMHEEKNLIGVLKSKILPFLLYELVQTVLVWVDLKTSLWGIAQRLGGKMLFTFLPKLEVTTRSDN